MTLHCSDDGVTWDSVFSITLDWPAEFLAGLFCAAHNESDFCTATFENTLVNFRLVHVDLATSDAIRIYPNPASTRLFIHLKNGTEKVFYKFIDLSGKTYRKGRLKGISFELDISDLPSNQYFMVQIFDGHKYVYVDKILKQ